MKMKVFFVLIVLFSVSLISLSAQWARTYGGAGSDVAYSIQQTSEGGYIAAGNTENTFWVVKTDPKGRVEWERSYDPFIYNYSRFEYKKAKFIQQTNDGGYIIAGMIKDIAFNGYNYVWIHRIYILKLSSEGTIEWNRYIEGPVNSNKAFTIQQTKDGEYIVATDIYTPSELSPRLPNYRIIKLGSDGSIKWYRCFRGIAEEVSPHSVQQTSDGGYIVAGETSLRINQLIIQPKNFLIIKLDSTGEIEWQKKYGGSSNEEANSIQQTSDGGYIVAGTTESFGAGGQDFWILKLNAAGNVIWQKAYGGTSNDDLNSIQQTSDGGYIAAGTTESFGAGGQDFWILKLDADGAIVWQKTFGGKKNDAAYSIHQTKDGGYIAAGSTESFGAGMEDVLILKLDQNGDIDSSSPFQGNSKAYLSVTTIIPDDASMSNVSQLWEFQASISLNTVKNTHAVVKLICGVSPVSILSLSSYHLSFAAFSSGGATQDQSFLIENGGNGLMTWNISDNAGWLTCSPTSGTGNRKAMVSVNPAGLLPGKYTAEITVSSSEAENSPQINETTLTVMNLADCTPPFGYFETPANYAQGFTGAIPVTGWALDDIEVTTVEIWRDAVTGETAGIWKIGDAIFVEGARPDVEQACPDYPLNYRAGWGYMLLTNMLPNHGNGTYRLHAYAYDIEGNRVLLGTKTITCSNATAVKPFGTIDTPPQGGDASGTAFVNFGWVLTPMSKTVPKDGSTISVWVDGVQVGALNTSPNVYNQYRVDVATAFPGLNNSGGPVGAFYLDTTKYPNGIHIISWVATDDGGAADGIGSRYFNIMNAGTSGPVGGEVQAIATGLSQAFSPTTGIPATFESLAELPVSFNPVWVKRGFDRDRPAEMITPDNYGLSRIEIEEVSPIEIDLAGSFNKFLSSSAARSNENPASRPAPPNIARYRGFQLVGTELRPLLVGSTLDTATGTFSWMPGPGFLGTYDLIFIKEEGAGMTKRIPVKVTIRPKSFKK